MHKKPKISGSDLYNVLPQSLAILLSMNGKRAAALSLLAGAVLAGTACAPFSGGGSAATVQTSVAATPTTSNPSVLSLPRASQLALDLANAEAAYDSQEKARLSKLVNGLYASGLAPKDDDQTDVLRMWATASGGEAQPYRGRLLGPAYVRGELAPGERWTSAQTFKSGEPSTLAVSHKGVGPVSISVSDQRARSVCKTAESRPPSCRFTPLYTQRYSIELVNEGRSRAVYFLVFD
jgi:hypothetical protein